MPLNAEDGHIVDHGCRRSRLVARQLQGSTAIPRRRASGFEHESAEALGPLHSVTADGLDLVVHVEAAGSHGHLPHQLVKNDHDGDGTSQEKDEKSALLAGAQGPGDRALSWDAGHEVAVRETHAAKLEPPTDAALKATHFDQGRGDVRRRGLHLHGVRRCRGAGSRRRAARSEELVAEAACTSARHSECRWQLQKL